MERSARVGSEGEAVSRIPTIIHHDSDPDITADTSPFIMGGTLFAPACAFRVGHNTGDSCVRIMLSVPGEDVGLFAPLTVKAMSTVIDQLTAIRDEIVSSAAKSADAALRKAGGQ